VGMGFRETARRVSGSDQEGALKRNPRGADILKIRMFDAAKVFRSP